METSQHDQNTFSDMTPSFGMINKSQYRLSRVGRELQSFLNHHRSFKKKATDLKEPTIFDHSLRSWPADHDLLLLHAISQSGISGSVGVLSAAVNEEIVGAFCEKEIQPEARISIGRGHKGLERCLLRLE